MRPSRSATLRLLALLGIGTGIVGESGAAASDTTKSEAPFGEEPPGTWAFTLQSSIQFLSIPTPVFLFAGRVDRNPIHYQLLTQVVSARCLPTKIWGSGWLRGRLEVSANVVGSAIVRGPESYFVGFAPGLRYYFVQPGWRILPYVELAGGPGVTDSSGVRYGQQQDLTFTYLLGAGIKGRLGKRNTFTFSVLDQHISNAYLTRPNYGFDSVGVAISLGHSF